MCLATTRQLGLPDELAMLCGHSLLSRPRRLVPSLQPLSWGCLATTCQLGMPDGQAMLSSHLSLVLSAGCSSFTAVMPTGDLLCPRWCITYKLGKSDKRHGCFGRTWYDEIQPTVRPSPCSPHGPYTLTNKPYSKWFAPWYDEILATVRPSLARLMRPTRKTPVLHLDIENYRHLLQTCRAVCGHVPP